MAALSIISIILALNVWWFIIKRHMLLGLIFGWMPAGIVFYTTYIAFILIFK